MRGRCVVLLGLLLCLGLAGGCAQPGSAARPQSPAASPITSAALIGSWITSSALVTPDVRLDGMTLHPDGSVTQTLTTTVDSPTPVRADRPGSWRITGARTVTLGGQGILSVYECGVTGAGANRRLSLRWLSWRQDPNSADVGSGPFSWATGSTGTVDFTSGHLASSTP